VLRGRGAIRAEDLALPEPAAVTPAIGAVGLPAPGGYPAEVRRRLALELAVPAAGVSTGQLARAAGVGLALARRELGALAARGELRRTGRGRAVRYVRA
jgi:hypothetical protein